MASKPKDSDILVPFEMQNFWPEYKEYLIIRRQNLFASIQMLRPLWECYRTLDQIWTREFQDVSRIRNLEKMFPSILFLNAHAKFRIAFD